MARRYIRISAKCFVVYSQHVCSHRVRGELNEWVSEVTEGSEVNLIKKLLPDTSLLLVNALSMHSRWLQPFDPINTFDKGLFYMPDKTR